MKGSQHRSAKRSRLVFRLMWELPYVNRVDLVPMSICGLQDLKGRQIKCAGVQEWICWKVCLGESSDLAGEECKLCKAGHRGWRVLFCAILALFHFYLFGQAGGLWSWGCMIALKIDVWATFAGVG
jgi:hypothetical protein